MINCRPHYLSREFLFVFFVAVYIPPQSEAGTKTALNELHSAISKQENPHPEVALLVAGNFNAGKVKSVLLNFYQHVKRATRGEKNSGPPLLHTRSPLPSKLPLSRSGTLTRMLIRNPAMPSYKPSNGQSVNTGLRSNRTTPARGIWQGLQTITDYKGKHSRELPSDTSLQTS